jgi:hypothetical protein
VLLDDLILLDQGNEVLADAVPLLAGKRADDVEKESAVCERERVSVTERMPLVCTVPRVGLRCQQRSVEGGAGEIDDAFSGKMTRKA